MSHFLAAHSEYLYQRKSDDERFLYLYLSLMIAVFSITTMLNIGPHDTTDAHLATEVASPKREGMHTLHGDPEKKLATSDFRIFKANTATIDEGSFEALLFLLRSHNVNAVLTVHSAMDIPESAYARALAVQLRLEEAGFTPHEVRVEVHFGNKGASDVAVTLYPF
ncbi:MAG: hypothetical protein KDD70_07825 [Bdellovibrionales bacterium]|nr:hypothetical protein [Bdellovibrionales bacterium]